MYKIFDFSDDCYDSEEEEETYKPTFHILKSDDQTNYNEDRNIPVTEEETKNNEKPVVVSIFKTLPHFEKTHVFQKTKPVVQQISQTEKPRVFVFKRLPHFDQIVHFKKTTEAIHKTHPSNIALAYYFNSLPHYETHYIFRKIHEAAPFVSRIKETAEKNEEEGVIFKILPHFNQPKFKDENRRKVKKLVRKKKISKESEVEFGRRLYPKTSVADFPLENIEEKSGLLNSYGELLSQ